MDVPLLFLMAVTALPGAVAAGFLTITAGVRRYQRWRQLRERL